jgi:tetratricopeptide (TPR) repeat protein
MAPARTVELHHSVASALSTRIGPEHGFALATLAYYLAHSGRRAEAADMFLEVAARAGEHGFLRSGVRLAAAAVECDDSEPTRARAAQIAERLSERQPAPVRAALGAAVPSLTSVQRDAGEPAPPLANTVSGNIPQQGNASLSFASEMRARAVQALLARDFDEVDRAIELLVAAGRDGRSVDRLRTVTLLVKGEHNAARALLERLREGESEQHLRTPRLTLTSALVAIAMGELEPAVRSCLEALARTREAHDTLGERASLSVLSMCYQRLGREADAERLAGAALARSGSPMSSPAARA